MAFLDLGSSNLKSNNFYFILTVAHHPKVQGMLEGKEEQRRGGKNHKDKSEERSTRLQGH